MSDDLILHKEAILVIDFGEFITKEFLSKTKAKIEAIGDQFTFHKVLIDKICKELDQI